MTDQLALFLDEAGPRQNGNGRGGSHGFGARGLLRALLQQGLDPDALEPAARLALLLDSERVDRGANGGS